MGFGFEPSAIPPEADDLAHSALFGVEGHGSADEPHADDGERLTMKAGRFRARFHGARL